MISTSTPAITTRLPIELWRKVIRYATLEDEEPEQPLEDVLSLPLHSKTTALSINSLRTKVSLVRVSSQWRTIATEFLWETVSNQTQDQLVQIARMLKESPISDCQSRSRSKTRSISRGWWIRSIHTRFDFGDDLKIFASALDSILKCCPRLHTFMHVHDFNGALPAGVIASLTTHCGTTLKRFQLDWGGVNTDDLLHLLEASPELQHISVGCTFAPRSRIAGPHQQHDNNELAVQRNFKFHKLRSLHFGNKEDGMTWRFNCHLLEASLWMMPSLRSVSIDVDARTCIEEVEGFLQIHGQQLTNLTLMDSGRVDGLALSWEQIFALCPRLVELKMSFNPFLTNLTTTAPHITDTAAGALTTDASTDNERRLITSQVASSLKRLTFINWEFFPQDPSLLPSPSPVQRHDPNSSALRRAHMLKVLDREFEPIGGELTPLLECVQFDFNAGRMDLLEEYMGWWHNWIDMWKGRKLVVEGFNRKVL